tara:strand:- start:21651 stop:23369 length:1719 start_codon:yes stop_codon:yes gene_type:complete
MENLIQYGIMALIVVVVLFMVGFSLSRMYKRSTKDFAIVKTGLGGEKIISSGGTLQIPGFQEIAKVNMRTLRIRVERSDEGALITDDFMRVDVSADFYIRVAGDSKSIAKAAQALGDRLNNPEQVKELMESKFVGALRSAASTMTMADLHRNRAEFITSVQNAIADELAQNGLELESVSLTSFDQTKLEFFNPNNAFDAEGRAKLAETIEGRKKRTNEVEQENRIAIEQRNFEADKESLAISQMKREAEIEQSQAIAVREAEQEAAIAQKREEQSRLEREAEIAKEKAVETAEIDKKLALDRKRIEQTRDLELAEQERQIMVAQKSEAESAARAKAAEAEKERVEKEEAVKTAGEVAGAERQKQIDVIDARRKAEREAVGITVAAQAGKQAAEDEAQARLIVAKADAESIKIKAEADEKAYAVEAQGRRSLNEADNALNDKQVALREKLALLESLPSIVEKAVSPLKNIDGIKILQGYNGAGNGGAVTSTGSTDPMSNLTNAALAYKAQSPLVESLLSELGITGNLEDLVSGSALSKLTGHKAVVESAPVVAANEPKLSTEDTVVEVTAPKE